MDKFIDRSEVDDEYIRGILSGAGDKRDIETGKEQSDGNALPQSATSLPTEQVRTTQSTSRNRRRGDNTNSLSAEAIQYKERFFKTVMPRNRTAVYISEDVLDTLATIVRLSPVSRKMRVGHYVENILTEHLAAQAKAIEELKTFRNQ